MDTAEENRILRAALRELFQASFSGADVRLLLTATGGSTMADPDNGRGRRLHKKCDRLDAALEVAREVLAVLEPERKGV